MNRSEKLNVLGHSWFSTKSVSAELFSRSMLVGSFANPLRRAIMRR